MKRRPSLLTPMGATMPLEGTSEAISELKRTDAIFKQVLASYGASKDEIDEIVAQLWADCLTGPRPLFHVFNGKSALKSWLTAISVNRWISLKRRETQHARAMERLAIETEESQPPSRAAQSDSSIVEILGPALRRALTACDGRN